MKTKSIVVMGALAMGSATGCLAQVSNDVVKIGVMSDMTGTFSTISGTGLVRAVELAVQDFGGTVAGKPIQVISANYQSRADYAATKAREWYDVEKVDAIIEATDSAAAIAMNKIAAEKKKPLFFAGSASTALVNQECSAYGIQWTYNTYALGVGVARAMMQKGLDSWYFITTDYAFGHALEADTMKAVKQLGGKVLGSSRHPLNTSDFASLLLQAQASKAKVVALANSGTDAQTTIRQAAEFGVTKNQTLASLAMFETDIKGMGLQLAQGLQYATAFYWDATPETRAFSNRFFEVHKAMPTMSQAGAYSSALHYLKAVAATKTDDADVVLKAMRDTPVNDFLAKNGRIRSDGLHVHDMYLAEAKKPSESKGEWDLVRITQTIPAKDAFAPLSESQCPLVAKQAKAAQ